MAEDHLEEVSAEVVDGLLRGWVDVYVKAQHIYDQFDDETKAWVDRKGYRVESLIPVVAIMQPEVRMLARALIEDRLGATARLSHPVPMVGSTDVEAKSGGVEMDETVAELKQRVEVLERELTGIRRAVRGMGMVASRLTDEHPVQAD
jgi:hypothetical protein